jgi:hypothetical protein
MSATAVVNGEQVRASGENALDVQMPTCDDDEIRRLAKLPPLEYARERTPAAEKLNIGLGALDTAVKAARRRNAE